MNLTEFLDKVNINGYAVLMYTDKFDVVEYPCEIKDEDKLLEIRIFNKVCEYRMLRGSVGEEFSYRYLDDNEKEYFEDYQRLDIDATKGKNDGKVYATGGGQYSLPIDLALEGNDLFIKIHSYVKYDDNGLAYIDDWRLVDFVERGKYEQ